MTSKLNLTRVTAICVDGRPQTSDMIDRYRKILSYMMERVEFGDIKLFSPVDPKIDGIKFTQIPEMDLYGYSNFCINDMHKHIDTDFCLIFQDDGFILNPELWTDDFFNYDYIGAPWPLYIGWPVEGRQVGNGGFSLRSKRLLTFIKDFKCTGNEDMMIVSVYRSKIDEAGFKFAPVDVAKNFAVEIAMDPEHGPEKTFGFHAKHLLDQALKIISNKS